VVVAALERGDCPSLAARTFGAAPPDSHSKRRVMRGEIRGGDAPLARVSRLLSADWHEARLLRFILDYRYICCYYILVSS
jgi:hypothetical protein